MWTGIKFKMDGCFIDYDQQCPTRINVQGVSVHFDNCIFRNIINVNDVNNGRIVDTRSNSTDSIRITNSTIYHHGDLILRTAGGALKSFEFDHNTVYLAGETFDLGVIKNVKITNNILYNAEWQGGDSIPSAGYVFSCDSVGSTGDFTDAERLFDLSNNNFYTEQSLVDIINSGKRTVAVMFDTITTAFITAGQCDTSDIIHEMLVFDNPPPPVDEYLQVYHDNYGILDAVEVPNFYADEILLYRVKMIIPLIMLVHFLRWVPTPRVPLVIPIGQVPPPLSPVWITETILKNRSSVILFRWLMYST